MPFVGQSEVLYVDIFLRGKYRKRARGLFFIDTIKEENISRFLGEI
jgi:hypothetical protein